METAHGEGDKDAERKAQVKLFQQGGEALTPAEADAAKAETNGGDNRYHPAGPGVVVVLELTKIRTDGGTRITSHTILAKRPVEQGARRSPGETEQRAGVTSVA